MPKRFKAEEYEIYNKKYGYDKYKKLNQLYDELFLLLPINKKKYFAKLDENNQYQFQFCDIMVYIDKNLGSQAEIIGTKDLSVDEKIKVHADKIDFYKNRIVQLSLWG